MAIPALVFAACVRLQLDVTAYGVPGTGMIVVDLQNHRFARRFSAGPASESEGFDGNDSWRADATGMPRLQGDPGERAEIRGWMHAIEGALRDGDASAIAASAEDSDEISFGAFRMDRDLHVPSTIASRSAVNGDWSARVVRADVVETRACDFSPPNPPQDASLNVQETSIPYTMDGGSPEVAVRVNGVPIRMLVDTGGQNVLTESAAKRLGLNVVGGATVAGGGGTATTRFAWVDRVSVGAVTMRRQPYLVLPDGAIPADGIVGYELFARFAAELDSAGRTLTLAKSAQAFGAPQHPVAFQFADRAPEVSGALDDIAGHLIIDTGSSLDGTVSYPVVRRYDLVKKLGARGVGKASGAGGAYTVYVAHGRMLRLGDVIAENPRLELLTRPGIWNGDGAPIASVGWGILRQWNIVLDYPERTLQLRDRTGL